MPRPRGARLRRKLIAPRHRRHYGSRGNCCHGRPRSRLILRETEVAALVAHDDGIAGAASEPDARHQRARRTEALARRRKNCATSPRESSPRRRNWMTTPNRASKTNANALEELRSSEEYELANKRKEPPSPRAPKWRTRAQPAPRSAGRRADRRRAKTGPRMRSTIWKSCAGWEEIGASGRYRGFRVGDRTRKTRKNAAGSARQNRRELCQALSGSPA